LYGISGAMMLQKKCGWLGFTSFFLYPAGQTTLIFNQGWIKRRQLPGLTIDWDLEDTKY